MKLSRVDFRSPVSIAPFGQVTGLTRKMNGSTKELDLELRDDGCVWILGTDAVPDAVPMTNVAKFKPVPAPAPAKK